MDEMWKALFMINTKKVLKTLIKKKIARLI